MACDYLRSLAKNSIFGSEIGRAIAFPKFQGHLGAASSDLWQILGILTWQKLRVGFLMLDLLEIPDSNPIEPLKYIRINEQRISADGI